MQKEQDELLVIETLRTLFQDEIKNDFTYKKNELIVKLANGKNAKITTKQLN